VGKQLVDAVGAHIVGGGYSFGEYDISIIVDAADDVTMAAVALAIAAGGAVKAAKATSLRLESYRVRVSGVRDPSVGRKAKVTVSRLRWFQPVYTSRSSCGRRERS
jgi:hypothetical protein